MLSYGTFAWRERCYHCSALQEGIRQKTLQPLALNNPFQTVVTLYAFCPRRVCSRVLTGEPVSAFTYHPANPQWKGPNQ